MAGGYEDRTACWPPPSVVCGNTAWISGPTRNAICVCHIGGLVGCTAHRNDGSRADFDDVKPYAPPLSEGDVERIAKRVVEMMKAAP